MKLWIDVQLPPSLCGWIQTEFGVTSSHVQDIGLREADDTDVFAALKHDGDVVFTKDEDFIDIVTRLGVPPQVLWLRLGNCSNDDLRSFLRVGLPLALDALNRGDPVVELRRKRE